MATETANDQLVALWKKWQNPPADMVAQLPRAGIKLDYLGHAETTAALIESDPCWSWEPQALDENGLPLFDVNEQGQPIGLWIRLTVHGVTRLGYGSLDRPKPDGRKELIGDAIRNAAMRFGVALALWSKSEMRDAGDDRFEHPSAAPQTNVTPLKGRLAQKAGKSNLASRGDHDEVIRLVNELAEGPKATFRQWYTQQVSVNGFPEGGLTKRVLSDEQLGSCREMALQAQRPVTTAEIQEAFGATDASEEPFT